MVCECGKKQRGPQSGASFYLLRTLLISLLLVEPILRSGQVFRPVVQVEIPAPGIICRLVLIRACPGEVPAGLPGLPILLAHRAPPLYGSAPHHAAPCHEMPGWGTRIRALRERMASRGPSRVLASQPAVNHGLLERFSRWRRSPGELFQTHCQRSCRKESWKYPAGIVPMAISFSWKAFAEYAEPCLAR